MKILIYSLFTSVLINCVRLRNVHYYVTPSSISGLNLKNLEQNQLLVKQLIDELTNNLHNQTLVNKIRNLNERNDHQQLISNLTGNLDDKDPLMSRYLDQKLKLYLLNVQQQSLNQTVDLMEVLKQFKDIVSIADLNLNNEFELININKSKPNDNKQEEFELINKNTTDLNSTKLSRMEFLTDTLISLLIGKLIGLKIGFFAGKLISAAPFSMKRSCCQTNTWPSDSPGMMAPTEPTSIIRNQFISMKSDKKPLVGNDGVTSTSSSSRTTVKPNYSQTNENRDSKKQKKKPVHNDDYELPENDENSWQTIDEDEYDETARPPTKSKSMKNKNHNYLNDADHFDRNFDKQVEASLGDLDEEPNINFKQYSNYHPIYSSTVRPINYGSKNNQHIAVDVQPHYTTHLPTQTTVQLYHPTTQTARKHYMLLTGK